MARGCTVLESGYQVIDGENNWSHPYLRYLFNAFLDYFESLSACPFREFSVLVLPSLIYYAIGLGRLSSLNSLHSFDFGLQLPCKGITRESTDDEFEASDSQSESDIFRIGSQRKTGSERISEDRRNQSINQSKVVSTYPGSPHIRALPRRLETL